MPVSAAAEGPATPRPRKSMSPWEQQPGENDLWYSRFLRFVALGAERSVSLVSTGMKNYYPVPAHWPMVAKQRQWRERAKAFDEAARKDEAAMNRWFVVALVAIRDRVPVGEREKTMGVMYTLPRQDEDESSDSNT